MFYVALQFMYVMTYILQSDEFLIPVSPNLNFILGRHG
jgi:hypothetical protein